MVDRIVDGFADLAEGDAVAECVTVSDNGFLGRVTVRMRPNIDFNTSCTVVKDVCIGLGG